MTDYPKSVLELLKKYGYHPIIEITQNTEADNPSSITKFGACLVPFNSEKEIVMIKHSYDLPDIPRNVWTIPGGNVESGESFEEAAIRETFEETGVKTKIVGLYKIFHFKHVNETRLVEEWILPIFFGMIIEEVKGHYSREISTMKKFRKLPNDFAGGLHEYYLDLIESLKKISY